VKVRLVDGEDIPNLIYEKFCGHQNFHQKVSLFMHEIHRNQYIGRKGKVNPLQARCGPEGG